VPVNVFNLMLKFNNMTTHLKKQELKEIVGGQVVNLVKDNNFALLPELGKNNTNTTTGCTCEYKNMSVSNSNTAQLCGCVCT